MLRWDDPVSFVTGATPSVRRAWEGLGILTVGDLLETLPRRYDDYSKIVAIRDARSGDVVTVQGSVLKCGKLNTFRKRFQIIRVVVKDETGTLNVNFFNQPWLIEELPIGREIHVSGKVVVHPRYGKSLANPIWEPSDAETVAAGKLAPVYPLTGTLAQKTYRRLLNVALDQIEQTEDPLTEETRERRNLLRRDQALAAAHRPTSESEAERGRERFAFDELLTNQLAVRQNFTQAVKAGAPAIPFDERFAKHFASSMPFPLTGDQKRAIWAALKSMEADVPMRRLLQGDVGSGKTAVAAFLAAHVVRGGYSTALLAPTDILAKQHAMTLQRLFAAHDVPLLLITRTDKRLMSGREERDVDAKEIMRLLDDGKLVVVGTHAILEARRLPPDLAFAVVDEQHRFGVEQRESLLMNARKDGCVPHFLSMTATPIPRSLALMLYGELEVSALKEKPAGRKPVETRVCVGAAREDAYRAILEATKRGEKAFIVCPLIDPSDALGVRSATDEWKRLQTGPLAGIRIGLLHGRLKADEKERVMKDLLSDQLDAIVATSVIEVGVDVPKATVIAIEGAERFGLAQLHQLRGRVGRADLPSKCFLMTDIEGESQDRLWLVARTQDGFALAEADLQRRGSGSLFGLEQSGMGSFKAARMTDLGLMVVAKEEAEAMLREDPTLEKHPFWNQKIERIRATAHLE